MKKPTTGPWTFRKNPKSAHHEFTIDGESTSGLPFEGIGLAQVNSEADAQLIVTAPEMLEAHFQIAQLVTDIINDTDESVRRKKIALIGNISLRIIEKAEGGS